MDERAAELVVPAEGAYLELIGQFVGFMAVRAGFSERESARIRLAVDEACANVVLHATGESGARFRVLCEHDERQLRFRVQDQGPLFDLDAVPEPDLDAPVERRQRGGLGIFLMRRVMDSVELRPCDLGKEIVLAKHVPGEKGSSDAD